MRVRINLSQIRHHTSCCFIIKLLLPQYFLCFFTFVTYSNFSGLPILTLWGPRNEIKEKTLHFIRKTDLNTILIIIFITKYKKKLQSFTEFGWFQTETAGTSKLFFYFYFLWYSSTQFFSFVMHSPTSFHKTILYDGVPF